MNTLSFAILLMCANPNLEIPDGTLLFLENSNRVVKVYTSATITHVGVVINADREPWVYEATPGKVRRVKAADYYEEIGKLNKDREKVRIWLVAPNMPYTDDQVSTMRTYLDSQLQRRYSVKNYVRKKPGDGIHCAELAASAMESTGLFDFDKCFDESPQSVFDKVKPNHSVVTDFHPAPAPTDASWCERSRKWWGGFFDWCSWSCYETWTFCR